METEAWRPQPYRAVNGHTMVQVEQNTWWNAICTPDCSACNGTDEYADEPWYDDGMI